MALCAVNILHLNGPLEAKQTQTGLHTNDQRGPEVRKDTLHVWVRGRDADSVCGWVIRCGHGGLGGWLCLWHGSGGYEGGGQRGWGRVRGLWPEGDPPLRPTGCPFACLSHFVFVCFHISRHLNNIFLDSHAFGWVCSSYCHVLRFSSALLPLHECVCACTHRGGYSNKEMLAVGLRPGQPFCSLSLLIFEETRVQRGQMHCSLCAQALLKCDGASPRRPFAVCHNIKIDDWGVWKFD